MEDTLVQLDPLILIGAALILINLGIFWVGMLMLSHLRRLSSAMRAARVRRRQHLPQTTGATTYHPRTTSAVESETEEANIRRMMGDSLEEDEEGG